MNNTKNKNVKNKEIKKKNNIQLIQAQETVKKMSSCLKNIF